MSKISLSHTESLVKNMIDLTEYDIDKTLVKMEKLLRKYCWIQEQVKRCDITRNVEFQKMYNGFYKVRRNAEWRRHYYELMEMAKNRLLGFGEVLRELKSLTGRLEASFASKLIATLDPSTPVIDKFVLGKFSLKLPYSYKKDRESEINLIYSQLSQKYEELMIQPISNIIREKFDRVYPWAKVTDLKKVDLVLWQIRD